MMLTISYSFIKRAASLLFFQCLFSYFYATGVIVAQPTQDSMSPAMLIPADSDSISLYRPFSDTLLVKPATATANTAAGDSARVRSAANSKKAIRALLWSALLPGAGQAYNRQYWKTPLAAGAVAGAGILAIKYKSDYNRYKADYNQELLYPTLSDSDFEALRQNKKSAMKSYNAWGAIALSLYGLNIADAYLSALIARDRKKHSPVKAAYYSAILPGMGQVYNKKYWKMPIVYGGLATSGYFIYTNKVELNRFREEYLARTHPGYGPRDNTLIFASEATLLKFYNRYKRYYEISIIAGSLWYILNILDATIDAHLHDFDMSDDLSWQIRPYMDISPQSPLSVPEASNAPVSPKKDLPFSAGLTFALSF